MNVAEQPAPLMLDDNALLAEWKPSYQKGKAMQANLALASTALGLIAAYLAWGWRWLAGALLIFSNWPYMIFSHLSPQQGAGSDAARCRERADARVDREMGHTAWRPQRARGSRRRLSICGRSSSQPTWILPTSCSSAAVPPVS
jgi:hypothetical protein